MANDIYNVSDVIPLSFCRDLGAGPVTGLSVTVKVTNEDSGAVMLATTAMTESVSGNGIYKFDWWPNTQSKASCHVQYTVGGVQTFSEHITITDTDVYSSSS